LTTFIKNQNILISRRTTVDILHAIINLNTTKKGGGLLLQLLRGIWVLAILINLCALLWFVLGSTANFQRGIDIITTVILMYVGIPSCILIIISIILLIKKWPSTLNFSVIVVIFIILTMLSLSPTLIKYVNTSGWLTENIRTDTLQRTEDGKYEYQLELVNLYQKNSYARLYLNSISTDQELRIPLEMDVYEIVGISIGKVNYWIRLEQTNDPNIYTLRTTKDFPLQDKEYDIDVNKGIAVRIK
jgi:hypothetical protein